MKEYFGLVLVIIFVFAVCELVLGAPLQVHPQNSRYFMDDSGDAVFLTGSHTWMNLMDFKVSGYPDFDWDEYLNFLESNNHNFARLWVTEYEYDIDNDVWATPSLYQRTGPGTAYDGRPDYNLSAYNQVYLDRLSSRVSSAESRGIYVSVMLFSSFGSDYQDADQLEAWESHPYHQGNNINNIDADCNSDGRGSELHTMCDSNVLTLQENYVKKIVDTVNEFDNVLFEIGNEMVYESVDFQYHMIDLIHDYELTKPKQHPVGMTTGGPTVSGGWTNMEPTVFLNSNADWISPSNTWGDLTNDPPENNGDKVIIVDTDHIPRPEHRDWVWKCLCRGYNPILMDVLQVPYPYDVGADWNDPENPIPRRIEQRPAMGHALAYAEKMDLATMTPQSSVSSTGYCLANPGNEYLIFQPGGGSFTVNLNQDSYYYEWFDATTGSIDRTGTVNVNGVTLFDPLFSGDAVLYLQATNPPLPSLIGHWGFEEGSGIIAVDSSGNNNDGTINDAIYTTDSKRGNYALEFDGDGDYVSILDSFDLDITTAITISAWVKPKTFPTSGSATIVQKGYISPDNTEPYTLRFDDNSQVHFGTYDGTTEVEVEWGHNYSVDNWHHVVGRFDGNTYKIFSDGVEKASLTDSTTFSVSTEPLNIGASSFPYYTRFFNGTIDDVRIYNYALTAEEILALYTITNCGNADSNSDGSVSITELINYITQWKAGEITITELIAGIGEWKNGC